MFVDNLRQAWRWWSVRVAAFGAALLTAAIAFPDLILAVWQALPDQLVALLPERLVLWINLLLTLATLLARLIRQPGSPDGR